jgi:hypothetical protein
LPAPPVRGFGFAVFQRGHELSQTPPSHFVVALDVLDLVRCVL